MNNEENNRRELAAKWFQHLRDEICFEFEKIEHEYSIKNKLEYASFNKKLWQRSEHEGDGGMMSIMHGNVFEKVGVNISTVHGEFTEKFSKKIPGTESSKEFFATGISVVAHMNSPLVPAVHFNTRYIETSKNWFGGGSDLTPTIEDKKEADFFHAELKKMCNQHDKSYYAKFKKQCDEYFYLKHRKEPRGVGGIFYDYLGNISDNDFDNNFAFTKDVGRSFLEIYKQIVRSKMYDHWSEQQKEKQLVKRGRYVEFNLLYDRGTIFGLETGGNTEAILMSLPPEVKWP